MGPDEVSDPMKYRARFTASVKDEFEFAARNLLKRKYVTGDADLCFLNDVFMSFCDFHPLSLLTGVL